MQSPQRVGPALLNEAAIGLSHLRPKQRRARRHLDRQCALSTGLLLFAIVVTYWIRPDRRVETAARVGGLAVAGGWNRIIQLNRARG